MPEKSSILSNTPSELDRGADPVAPALGQATARGVAWLTAQTVAAKLLGTAGQLVLAYFLVPDDFGFLGLANTVAMFAVLIQQGGIREVLIHRQSQFRRWANAAFWMSAAAGIVSAALMIAAAPVAGAIYWQDGSLPPAQRAHEQAVFFNLLCLFAANTVIASFGAVSFARLHNELRFREIATLGVWTTALWTGLSVTMAIAGFGAYSFVLPHPIVSALRTAVLLCKAPPPLKRRPQLRRWRYLLGDSSLLLTTSFFAMVTGQAPLITLGIVASKETVGIYFFGYMLSYQILQLLTVNLAGALFPALSKLQAEPARQSAAFLRASRMLGLVGVPACLLLAAAAGPLIHILFRQDWQQQAIPVVRILSLGMAIVVIGSQAASLLQAQGRFAALAVWSATYSLIFVVMCGTAGGWATSLPVRPDILVALAAATGYLLIEPSGMVLALWPSGVQWRRVVRLYLTPLLLGGIAFSIGLGCGRMLRGLADSAVVELAVIVVVGGGIYLLLARKVAPDAWMEFQGLLRHRQQAVSA